MAIVQAIDLDAKTTYNEWPNDLVSNGVRAKHTYRAQSRWNDESSAFFAFHTINAWTEPSHSDPSATDIICTLSAYDGTDVLKKFYYENLLSTSVARKDSNSEKGDSSRPEL
ncbi:hypothetical protein E2P81_ATG05519 [Venturia nashicola]|nr:hypothetical protein E2P81_ATG05519 [Venturia nashicola]